MRRGGGGRGRECEGGGGGLGEREGREGMKSELCSPLMAEYHPQECWAPCSLAQRPRWSVLLASPSHTWSEKTLRSSSCKSKCLHSNSPMILHTLFPSSLGPSNLHHLTLNVFRQPLLQWLRYHRQLVPTQRSRYRGQST